MGVTRAVMVIGWTTTDCPLVKRQMCGRANPGLLRRRVLLVG
jgi:hypothetical protein